MGKIRDWLDKPFSDKGIVVFLIVMMLIATIVMLGLGVIEDSIEDQPKKIKVYEYTNVVGDIVICKQIRYREPFQTLSNCNDNMTYKLMSGEVREYYINTVVDNK